MKKFGSFLLALLLPSTAAAANTSVYTSFNLKKCTVLTKAVPDEEFGGASICKGYGKLKMYFAEGDLRTTIAFGTNPKNHCAISQTFGQFNSVASTIEWRLHNGKPIATIQRWHVAQGEDNPKDKDWLVVTKLESHNSCRMAVVEAAYPNANAKAREVADQLSLIFKCVGNEPKLYSNSSTEKFDDLSSGACEKN